MTLLENRAHRDVAAGDSPAVVRPCAPALGPGGRSRARPGHLCVLLYVTACALLASAQTREAQPAATPTTTQSASASLHDRESEAQARRLIAAGVKYLISTQEAEGGWAGDTGPGVSALVLKALIQEPTVGRTHAAVRRGLEFILKAQRDDGGIYSAEGLLKSYESSVALSMFGVLQSPAYEKHVTALQKFLKNNQWDEGEGKSPNDPFYGGVGYGRHKRPDLSNTQMMLEALEDSGLSKDDPVYQKALVFIQRCQMMGEMNDQVFARGSTQGGFIYTPVGGGESAAETVAVDGRTELRCYGSMTYAGFKSLLYAGLGRDDRRVQAALDWVRRHWTLEFNPNMPAAKSREGLFYFYHVFARALAAWGEPVIVDKAGRAHAWREELVEQLAKSQHADGSWVNDADRWMEGLPVLTTAYSVLALQAAYPAVPEPRDSFSEPRT